MAVYLRRIVSTVLKHSMKLRKLFCKKYIRGLGSTNNFDEISNEISMGTSDFAEILKSSAFVDKTPMIKVFLKSRVKTHLITAPRKFGKSSMLSMLKKFIDIQDNDSLFEDGELKITQEKDLLEQHLGKYPVIHIDLKLVRLISSFKDVQDMLKIVVHRSYRQHLYLKDSNYLNDRQRKYVDIWCDIKMYEKYGTEDVIGGLRLLSEYLNQHFTKKCVVLVDDYDYIIMQAAMSMERRQLNQTLNYFSGIFVDLFNNNESIERGMITGVSNLLGNIFHATNFKCYSFFEMHQYNNFYGITETEIGELFAKHGIEEPLASKARAQYGGYPSHNGIQMYNLWSVINFLCDKKIDNYWVKSGIIEGLDHLLNELRIRISIDMMTDFDENGQYQPVNIAFNNRESLDDLFKFLQTLNERYTEMSHINYSVLFKFLLEQGYLIVHKEENERHLSSVKIPNEEVRDELMEQLNRSRYRRGNLYGIQQSK